MRRRNKVGRTRIKLAEMLEAELRKEKGLESIVVYPEDLWRQEGALSHMTWDLARWGVDIKQGHGLFIVVHSFDTMKACVRHGFTVDKVHRGGPWER